MTETTFFRWRDCLAAIETHMRACRAHPARTVVLLPYAQLMPLASRLWAEAHPDGFSPRFETTQNWCARLGEHAPAPSDIAMDAGLDVLTARALLEGTGLSAHADAGTSMLLEAAYQLAPLAAAVPPEQRAEWGERSRRVAVAGWEMGVLSVETAIAQLAVTWAASSSYASDMLYASHVIETTDALIAIQGFQRDPLPDALRPVWGSRMAVVDLAGSPSGDKVVANWHACRDAQEEAQRAAACVLRHLQAGRAPVALVVTDRALTRRVRAMLDSQRVQIRDETGWKLSTSRAGAQLMGALRACAWNASSDAVLDWVKNTPAFDVQAVRQLEVELRRRPQRAWRKVPMPLLAHSGPALQGLLREVEALREMLQRGRPLAQWLSAFQDLLRRTGLWDLLHKDVAGAMVLSVLRLGPGGEALPVEALWAKRRLSASEFAHWVDHILESESFKPDYPAKEQVVILPLAQMLGRSFAAAVLPGCDEVRFTASPEPAGMWTAAQRAALGLPTREALATSLRAAWHHALCTPQVDVLWRSSDDGGEPLLPSPLVQQMHGVMEEVRADDPRAQRELMPAPVDRPLPVASQLRVTRLSASAYQDLRHCPYRYFALRQLGLKEAEEIEGELDKRDFGLWLHAVLQRFHSGLDGKEPSLRRAQLDAAAQAVVKEQGLAEDEFLPFLAAWPQVREGYLSWLLSHEAEGWRYVEGECESSQPLGQLTLFGRLDRIDRMADGTLMVIDYKTEPRDTTSRRIRDPYEDTQLAFYAALRSESHLRAAYVNVGERDPGRTYEQTDIVAVRDALVEGIISDHDRIAAGAGLPALGDGSVCDFCAARGLCRKDFWADSQRDAREGNAS